MTAPDTDTLAGLLAECTPGLWASEILMGSDPNGDEHPTDVEVMSEKGYFIHSHDLGYSDRVDVEILANARLIALAPELAAEVIAHRAQAAKDKARITDLEARLAAAEAGEDALAEALRSYRADLCEGFCLEAEWSDEAHNHPEIQRDCGGCLAAAALAAYGARRKG